MTITDDKKIIYTMPSRTITSAPIHTLEEALKFITNIEMSCKTDMGYFIGVWDNFLKHADKCRDMPYIIFTKEEFNEIINKNRPYFCDAEYQEDDEIKLISKSKIRS